MENGEQLITPTTAIGKEHLKRVLDTIPGDTVIVDGLGEEVLFTISKGETPEREPIAVIEVVPKSFASDEEG
jgi:hypothetical protein